MEWIRCIGISNKRAYVEYYDIDSVCDMSIKNCEKFRPIELYKIDEHITYILVSLIKLDPLPQSYIYKHIALNTFINNIAVRRSCSNILVIIKTIDSIPTEIMLDDIIVTTLMNKKYCFGLIEN